MSPAFTGKTTLHEDSPVVWVAMGAKSKKGWQLKVEFRVESDHSEARV